MSSTVLHASYVLRTILDRYDAYKVPIQLPPLLHLVDEYVIFSIDFHYPPLQQHSPYHLCLGCSAGHLHPRLHICKLDKVEYHSKQCCICTGP